MKQELKRLLAIVLSLSMVIAAPVAMPKQFVAQAKAAETQAEAAKVAEVQAKAAETQAEVAETQAEMQAKAAGAVGESVVTDFSYDFAYTTRGYADGTIRIHATEDGIYKVFWGDGDEKKLEKDGVAYTQIANVVVKDNEGSYNLVNDYTAIPAGAKTVLVYKKDQLQYVYALPEDKIFEESENSYQFGSLSDPHFGRYTSVYESDSAEALNSALEFYKEKGVNFVAVSGDITSVGSQKELDEFNAVLEKYPEVQVLTTIGNHDSRTTISNSNTSVLDTSVSRWYNSISSTYYTVDEDGTVHNKLNGYPILANDALENPIPTYYRAEAGGDPLETEVPGLDFVTEAGGNIFIFFHEIAQTGETFDVDKLITTGQMDWLEKQLETYKDRNVFLYFHSFLCVNTLEGDATDYHNCVGDLFNNGGYSYDLDFKDTVKTSSGYNLQGLLTKYGNVNMLSGHSHWSYSMQNINPQLNLGKLNGGKGGTLVHVASVGGPRIIGENDKSRTELNGYAAEGTMVTVYDDCIVYHSVDFYKNRYEAYATYIVPAGDSGTYEPVKNPNHVDSDTAITGEEYTDIEDMTLPQILSSDYNLTLGAAYVYSSRGSQNTDGALTDGKPSGQYCSTKEGKSDDQYIVITLDAEQDVANLDYAYLHFVNDLTDSASYQIQISQDGETYETIGDYQNMTYENTTLQLDTSKVTLGKFKYIRLNLTDGEKNYGYQISEMALIGHERNLTPNTAGSESHLDENAPIDESEFINTDYNLIYTADYTQSSVGGENKAGALTDGSLHGFLNTERSSSAKQQEIVIDLGKGQVQEVSNIDYFLLYCQNRDTYVTEFQVSLSEDGNTYEPAGTYTNVDLDTNHFDPDLSGVTIRQFRYVKLECLDGHTNYGYQINEFAVIGKEPLVFETVEDQSSFVVDAEQNPALGKPVYVSSTSENEGKDPTVLTDGKTDKFWSSIWDSSYTSDYIVVDLGRNYHAADIDSTLICYQNASTFCEDLRIEFSDTFDEENPTEGFYEVAKQKAASWEALQRYADPNGYVRTKIYDAKDTEVRYVKFQLNGHKNWGFQIKEIAVLLKKKSIENAEVTITSRPYEYTGNAIIPDVTVVYENNTLVPNADYKLVCSNNINAGTATVEVQGMGAYDGSITTGFVIAKKPIKDTTITATVNQNGTVTVTVTNPESGKKAVQGEDYTYTTVDDGEGNILLTVTASEKNYTGVYTEILNKKETDATTESPTETTTKAPIETATDETGEQQNVIENAEVTIAQEQYEYTGSAIIPDVTVVYGDTTLVPDVDYTLVFGNNIDAGTATVEIQGIGDYSGSVTKEFTIAPCDISTVKVEDSNLKKHMEYNAKERTPNVTLTLGDYQLQPAKDYIVSYQNNVDAGTARLIVTALNENFTGSLTRSFVISKKPIKDTTITATVNDNNTVTVKITNPETGKEAIQGQDYTYTAVSDGQGNILLTVTASEKNYTGVYTETLKGNQTDNQQTPQVSTKPKKITVNQVKLKKVKNIKKRAVSLTWKKIKGVKGYQIRYAVKKNMKKAKKKLLKKNVNRYTLKKLKQNKTYYIQVRAYKVSGKKKYYGKWSKKKKIKIKIV